MMLCRVVVAATQPWSLCTPMLNPISPMERALIARVLEQMRTPVKEGAND